MKYKCDMVRDLMPLCLDDSATQASKQAVIEHMAECESCVSYYETMSKALDIDEAMENPEKKYVQVATKLRKKKRLIRYVVSYAILLFVLCCLNYSGGYRFTAKAAANTSGRLNYRSELIGSYEWNNWEFFFYDSYSCYDVVSVKKTWHGWHVVNTSLNWPKVFDEDGICTAGALYHCSENKGIQLFPVIASDERVCSISVTVFGKTVKTNVRTDEFTLIAIPSESDEMSNSNLTATAYDALGNAIYQINAKERDFRWKAVN